MATIVVACPKCGTKYRADEAQLGRIALCRKCSTRFETRACIQPGRSAGKPGLPERLSDLVKRFDHVQQLLKDSPSGSEVVGWSPIRELAGLKQNVVAAVNALSSGRDPTGRPIRPADVGGGLERMCRDTVENPRWAVPAKVAMGHEAWKIAEAVLRAIQEVARSLQHSQEPKHEPGQSQARGTVSSRDQKRTQIAKRLDSLKSQCGAAGLLVGQVAQAMQNGVVGDGKPTNPRDEIATLAVAAQLIEAERKQDVALQLVFIMKEIQDLGNG